VDKTLAAMQQRQERGLILTNLVDFDAKFGHRNNPGGYAQSLAEFDQRVPELLAALAEDDVLVITADHGNDPTTPSTDHAREYVPLLMSGKSIRPANIGVRESFADLAATIAEMLQVKPPPQGRSFKSMIFNR
jgi:phosphopentomutase